MARAARRKAKTGTTSVDLSKVEGRINVDEGEHLVVVDSVTEEQGDKAPYLKWKFKVAEGDSEGGMLFYNTSLSEQALWNLRTLLEALGVEIPDEAMEIDHEEMVGKELMVTVEKEVWEGKKQSKIVDFFAAEDAKPAKRSSKREHKEERTSRRSGRDEKKGRGKKEPEGLTQEAINDMAEDELEEAIKEFDLDVDIGEFRTLRKKQAAVIDAAEQAEVLLDD